jgi:hypothetical protein
MPTETPTASSDLAVTAGRLRRGPWLAAVAVLVVLLGAAWLALAQAL